MLPEKVCETITGEEALSWSVTVKLYGPGAVGDPLIPAVASPKVDQLNVRPEGKFPEEDHEYG